MTKSEQVVNQCLVECTQKMHETLKMFGPKKMDKVLLRYDIEKVMKRYLIEQGIQI